MSRLPPFPSAYTQTVCRYSVSARPTEPSARIAPLPGAPLTTLVALVLGTLLGGCDFSSSHDADTSKGRADSLSTRSPASTSTEEAKTSDRLSLSRLNELARELKQVVDDTTTHVSDISPSAEDVKNLTNDEINKLFAFEYRVESLKKDLPADQLEAALSKLGQERWECFDVEAHADVYQIFCRRRPQTYLRYIPRFFP